jgi:hypothetical protein
MTMKKTLMIDPKKLEPIRTLKRWVGKHKSVVLWHDPQPGDYGYFENVQKEMFFDGISWLPVKDFLDMHNKAQAKHAFEIEGKKPKPTLKIIGQVKALSDLDSIENPNPGDCQMCLEDGTIYVWAGDGWVPISATDANFEAPCVPPISLTQTKPKPEEPKSPEEIFPRKRIIKRKKYE